MVEFFGYKGIGSTKQNYDATEETFHDLLDGLMVVGRGRDKLR
jgi:hypothetical protein